MTKEQWMQAWERVAARDKLAARLMLLVVALVSGDETEPGVREMMLTLALECSVERLTEANEVLAEEGLATVRWLQ